MLKRFVSATGLAALIAVSLAGTLSGRAANASPPVLFVPEFCSAAAGFSDLMRLLPDRRFGRDLGFVSFDASGALRTGERPGDASTFAMEYRAPQGAASASRIGIRDKAFELKRVVDYVKTATGSSRVILIGHGMGGLVARAYVQGLGINADGDAVLYDGDIAGVIALDTPHRGVTAEAMPEDWDPGCASADSYNWAEMQPSSSALLLDGLNRTPWPSGTRLDAIASYYSQRVSMDTDGVVLRESQDARAISEYWAAHADVRVWPQALADRRIDNRHAHSAVIRTSSTAALIAALVDDLDAQLLHQQVHLTATDGLPESSHPTSSRADTSWSYTLAGNPSSIDVAFDPRTYVEEDYDYIYVMDGNGNNVEGSPFTGDLLAGRTIRISGATVRIRLTTDGSVNEFGFRMLSVNAASGAVASSPLPESPHPYDNDYHGGWAYTLAGDPSAIDVTFDARTKVEADYDYIYVTDGDGNDVGDSPYTGTELAGKTIRVQGDTVRVILESDGSATDFGYQVISVRPVSGSTASVRTQGASATTERTSTGVTYHTTFTLCETSGRSAVNIASIRVNLSSSSRSGGATFAAGGSLTTTSVAAGACFNYRLNVTSTNGTDLYTSVSFVITYSDNTGVQSSYTTPTSASISPPTSTTTPAPPTSSGSRFDGTYNLFVRMPTGGGGSTSRNMPSYMTIRGTRITTTDNYISGTVDLQFGTVRMTSTGCLVGNLGGADWEGIMNQSAQAGSNFGQGTWECHSRTGAPVANRSWQATQAR